MKITVCFIHLHYSTNSLLYHDPDQANHKIEAPVQLHVIKPLATVRAQSEPVHRVLQNKKSAFTIPIRPFLAEQNYLQVLDQGGTRNKVINPRSHEQARGSYQLSN